MSYNGLAFKEWALKDVAYWTADISELKEWTIGVDAEDYLAGLLVSHHREPLLPALGGLPFSLKQRVDEDLQRFKDADIDLIFVFNGLELPCNDRTSILKSSARATETLESAWRIYDSGKGDEAVSTFGRACTYRIYHIMRAMQAHLHEKGYDTWVAPYSAAAQLCEMERDGQIFGIMGSANCMLFAVEGEDDGVILDFDWESGKYSHTNRSKCCEEIGNINNDQLRDLFLLCGWSILPGLPELDVQSSVPKLEAARTMLQRYNNDAYTLCRALRGEDLAEDFHRARLAIKHATRVDFETMEVCPRDRNNAVSDMHEFAGQHLPNELYYYLTRGLAGTRILNWRTRSEVLETPPLDGGLSQAYRDLVSNKLAPLRAQALIIITNTLHRYWHKTDVKLSCWFNDGKPKMLNIVDNTEAPRRANSWHVTESALPSVSGTEDTPLRYAISTLLNDAEAKKTVTPRPEGAYWMLNVIPELRPNIIWRFLENRGYIKADHTLSAWGKSLNAALQKASDNTLLSKPDMSREIEEAIFMALELIRLDCLNTRNMFQSPPYSGQPMRGSDTDKQNTLLFSRIACLATFQHEAIGYTGPLSRHILAYHQVTAAVRGALRDLVEMHACNMFLSGSCKREIAPPDMFNDLSFSLPFVHEPDAGLALLVKSYLDELSHDGGRRRGNIAEWFAHAKDIEGDLDKVWKLFDAINAGVQAADSSIINADTKKMFQGADEWLALKRTAELQINGTS